MSRDDRKEVLIKTVVATLLRSMKELAAFKVLAGNTANANEIGPLINKYKLIKEESDKLKPYVAGIFSF